jgi:two-component system cell cycle sensor histidine kinase/response regulator CckA
MSKDRLNLLIVEDDPSDAELVCLELERGGFEVVWERVDHEVALLTALRGKTWDLIVSDFAMPGFNGLRAFDLYRRQRLDTPFIFISGALGEARAVEAMRAGARDYLVKGDLTRLTPAVRRELADAANRRHQRAAEESAQRQQRRLALAMEASQAAIFEVSFDASDPPDFSGAWQSILGVLPSEFTAGASALRDWLWHDIHPDDRARVGGEFRRFEAGALDRFSVEYRVRNGRGEFIDVAVFARAVTRDDHGGAQRVIGVVLGLADRKQLEEQLRQSQKMEAVGQLAGGVAHDFNNILTAILSFSQFALEALLPGDIIREDISEVLKAAERARSLTNQLLAFSRRKAIAPRVVNINELQRGFDRLLQRLLGEQVVFESRLSAELWNCRIDPDAFEQVVMNLAVNARDAMPAGGSLTIETRNVHVDVAGLPQYSAEIPPGDYVAIIVSDSGTGMDKEVLARIFEPFFTTKEQGKGTGLGLSMCYGIVKQADGFIWPDSAVGRGTRFHVLLPRVEEAADAMVIKRPAQKVGGREAILLVEDDSQVRRLTARTLVQAGYTVLESSNATEALELCRSTDERLSLLLSDLVLPGMDGRSLADEVRSLMPEMKVLFMSGYSATQSVVGRGGGDGGPQVMPKPFTPETLTQTVRETLDTARPA